MAWEFFDAAVSAPFRMQPGLRRLPDAATQLTPIAPGSRHQREKLAVLSAFWPQALCASAGFDAAPALAALCRHAAREHPQAWHWHGGRATALALGVAVRSNGEVAAFAKGAFGLGDEVERCLRALPPRWRLAGLASLAFAEDFAVVDGASATVPWMAVALPSHWAPDEKVGRSFAAIHAPVADARAVLDAAAPLLRIVTGGGRWERHVWTVTDHPRLHAHPARVATPRWRDTPVERAWLRSERQTFVPVDRAAAGAQAVFTIRVAVDRLADAAADPARAAALHAAVASMTPAVLAYRNLDTVREPLLAYLASCMQRTPAS